MTRKFDYLITEDLLRQVPKSENADDHRKESGLQGPDSSFVSETAGNPAPACVTTADFLKSLGYSHRILARLKRAENGICLCRNNTDPVWIHVSEPLLPGDHLLVTLEEKKEGPHRVLPADIPLDIVYEDEDILVVNKPVDMPVHPSIGNHDNTLANALAFRYQDPSESFICRVINRLDRDTTGLLIVARNALAGAVLSADMKERRIHRTYLAIVKGQIAAAGTVTAPIARADGSAIKRHVDFEHGEYACTHYNPVRYRADRDLTLLRLQLETGRTHQIRVHMGYLKHPLIGDFLYYPDQRYISRQALHSWKLSFHHPITRERMEFTQPLPEDMQFILH